MSNLILSGYIGDYGCDLTAVRNHLSTSSGPVEIQLDSLGGDALAGIAIFRLLRSCGRPVKTRILSVAASAASLVFLAGDERLMPRGTLLMIHNVSAGYASGDSESLRETADLLDTLSSQYAEIYASVTGKSAEECRALMDAETWFDSAASVSAGFATALEVQSPAEARDTSLRVARYAASAGRFVHPPSALLSQTEDPMKIAELEARVSELEKSLADVTSERDALKADADKAAARAKADAEAKAKADAEAAVSSAITSGAVTEEERARFVADHLANPEATGRMLAKLSSQASKIKELEKKDGHLSPLKLNGEGGAVSAEAFAASAKDAEDGEARAALYREFPQFAPNRSNATAVGKFAKANPKTAKALGLTR